MQALRMIKKVNKDGIVTIQIPEEMGKKVEIIIFPAAPDQAEAGDTEYFECIAEDGAEYLVHEWTEEDFNRLSKTNAFKDDDTTVEDIFNV
jgi:hypothetical protein